MEMNHLSGSPIYSYELSRALKKLGHNVTVVSTWDRPFDEGERLKENLEKEGITCNDWFTESPCDLIIASQGESEKLLNHYKVPALNIIHSELPYEEPMKNEYIKGYIAIRESIQTHWQKQYPGDWHVVGNPIDTERFNPKIRRPKDRSYYLTIIPCTIDTLRQKMLENFCSQAHQYNRFMVVGINRGIQLPQNEYFAIMPPTFDIEQYYAIADRVAGVMLGRVNLEAAACGIPSLIVEPRTLKETDFPAKLPKEYDSLWVAKKLLNIAQNK